MATDPRKRQKKLERRASKRKEKKHEIVREQSAGLDDRMTVAAGAPVLHCWIYENLWTEGMGSVLLSRLLPNGSVAVAVFLVDRYCLGVKNAFGVILGRSSYDSRFVRQMRADFKVRDVAPATARKLVEEAVAYAQDLGFPPHPDYQTAKLLFGDIDAGASKEEFEFGKDGKPFFIAGPHDSPQRCKQILAILANRCGPGGSDYLIPIGGSTMILPPDDGQEPSRLLDRDEMGNIIEFRDEFDDETEP